jgi:hypothetical protein
MRCPGGEVGCPARRRWCLCGVIACWEHGHTAYGDDVYCAYLHLRAWEMGALRRCAGLTKDEAPRPRLVQDIRLDTWEPDEGRHG